MGMTTAVRRQSSLPAYRIIEPMVEMQMTRQAQNRLFNMTVSNFMAVLLGRCGEVFTGGIARLVPTTAMAVKAHPQAIRMFACRCRLVSADTALRRADSGAADIGAVCGRLAAHRRGLCRVAASGVVRA